MEQSTNCWGLTPLGKWGLSIPTTGSARPGWEQERRLAAIPRGAEPKSQRDVLGGAARFSTFLVSPQSIFSSAPNPRSAGFPPSGLKAPQRCGAALFLLRCRSKALPVAPRGALPGSQHLSPVSPHLFKLPDLPAPWKFSETMHVQKPRKIKPSTAALRRAEGTVQP